MTGRDLIKWIQDNKAEDKEVIVEHRDSGGTYRTAEHLGEFGTPALVEFRDESFGVINTVIYNSEKKNAMII